MDSDLAIRLALALAIGLVVGLERGWRERDAAPGSRTAGIRSYALAGLLGGIIAALARASAAPLLTGIGFLGFIAVFAWFKHEESRADGDFSVTGVIAAMLVFALGALAVMGDPEIAAAGGIVTAGLLASREALHRLLQKITFTEFRATLLLAAMAGVILPLLPDRALDAYGAINPRAIWTFAILIAALSYAGYIGMRALGAERGLLVAALTGALVSSTAVTIAFARRARSGEANEALVAGATAAGAVSLARVLLVASVIAPGLAASLAAFAVPAAIVFLLPAALMLMRQQEADGALALGNPFELLPVLGFALLLGIVGFAAAFVSQTFGAAGLYPLAGLSGLADVDAFSVSTARLAGNAIGLAEAGIAILICAGVNALARSAYGLALGGRGFGVQLFIVTAAALASGGLCTALARHAGIV